METKRALNVWNIMFSVPLRSTRQPKPVPPGFWDSAIAEFIAKSSKLLRNFHKSSHIFVIAQIFRRFSDKTCPVTSSQRTFSQRKVVSQFEKWKWTALRSHHARFSRATLDKRTESGTNPRYSFGLQRCRPFICSGRSHGLLSITQHRYNTALGDTVKKVVEFAADSITSLSNLVRSIKFGAEFC